MLHFIQDKFSSFRLLSVLTVIPLGLGILAGSYFPFGLNFNFPIYFYVSLTASLFICIFLYITVRRKNNLYLLYAAAISVFGFIYYSYFFLFIHSDNVSNHIQRFYQKNCILYGVISEEPELKGDLIKVVISADSVSSLNNTLNISGVVLAYVYQSSERERVPELFYGERIKLEGTIEELPIQRNPGEFDYGRYLRLHGINAIFKTFGFDKLELLGEGEVSFVKKNLIYPVRRYSIETIDKFIGGQEGEFMKGLVLGERSNIAKEIKDDFVNAGVTHIIAVSGLNVAYVAIMVYYMILLPLPISYPKKVFILVGVLFFYMFLTGSSPSIVRATIMASVYYFSSLLERKHNPINTLAFAALVILAFNPLQLFDSGFILSFSAIFSLIVFHRIITNWLKQFNAFSFLEKEKWYHKLSKLIYNLVVGTLSAQILTLPITAIMFKKISLVSFITNIPAIPSSNIALGIGFIFIVLSVISGWLASVFASVAKVVLYLLLEFIHFFANFELSFLETDSITYFTIVVYYIIVVLIFIVPANRVLFKTVSVIIVLTVYFIFSPVIYSNRNLQLTYLDVGNSNSALFRFPTGTNILVNAGGSKGNFNSADRTVIPYLKHCGVELLDALLITSLNEDEFVNMFYLLSNFKVERIYIPSYYRKLFTESGFADFFSKQNIEYIIGSKIINEKGSFRVYVNYDSTVISPESMLIDIEYGKQKFRFCDFGNAVEEKIYYRIIGAEECLVLLVPGSGSFSFISPEFIIKSNPKYIVVSSQKKTKKKLHSDLFDNVMESNGYDVSRTSEMGAVIFESNGDTIRVVNWR